MLVLIDGPRHGHNLVCEEALSTGCTILTTPGKGVLVFPAHALLRGHMLGGLDHGIDTVGLLHLRIHKSPSQGRVVKFRSPLKGTLGFAHDKGRTTHGLDTTRNCEIDLP